MTSQREEAPAAGAQQGARHPGPDSRFAARARYFWNATPSLLRVLIICAARAGDGGGADSATFPRLIESARRVVQRAGAVADVLDLSWLDWGRLDDCNARIRERWFAAHGVVILAPAAWHLPPSPLKLMAEGIAGDDCGILENPGRSYGVVVQDSRPGGSPQDPCNGVRELLERLGLVPVEGAHRIGIESYTGFYEPRREAGGTAQRYMQDEVGEVARAVVVAARKLRAAARWQSGSHAQC